MGNFHGTVAKTYNMGTAIPHYFSPLVVYVPFHWKIDGGNQVPARDNKNLEINPHLSNEPISTLNRPIQLFRVRSIKSLQIMADICT